MFAICQHKKANRRWMVFKSASERDAEFSKRKDYASKAGCGPMCDCFRDNGNSFIHCGEWETSIVEDLKMEN